MNKWRKGVAIVAAAAFAFVTSPQTAFAGEVTINASNFPDHVFREWVSSRDIDQDGNGMLNDTERRRASVLRKYYNDGDPNKIADLRGIQYLGIQELNLVHSNVSSVDLSSNAALRMILLSNGRLSSIKMPSRKPMTRDGYKTTVFLNNNQLSALDLSPLNNGLGFVDVHQNRLTSLNMPNVPLRSSDDERALQLEWLLANDNALTSINVRNAPKLTDLQLSNNRITSLDVSSNRLLENLEIANNPISKLELKNHPFLWKLDASGSGLRILDLSKTDMQYLKIERSNLLAIKGSEDYRINDSVNGISRTSTTAQGTSIDFKASGVDYNRIAQNKLVNATLNNGVLQVKDVSKPAKYTYYLGDISNGPSDLEVAVKFTGRIDSFQDVNNATPHKDDIMWLANVNITTGYDNGDGTRSFRGTGAVLRQDMAAFLRREASRRSIGDARTWKPSAADWGRFTDVNRSTPHAEDILWLAHAGISTGYRNSNGTWRFGGTIPVYRQDMAAFLKRIADKAGKSGGVTPKAFRDVNSSTPHAAEIRWLGGSGISTGFPDGTFRGGAQVIRQDMAAFIHRLDTLVTK